MNPAKHVYLSLRKKPRRTWQASLHGLAESAFRQAGSQVPTSYNDKGARTALPSPELAALRLHLSMLAGAEYFYPRHRSFLRIIQRLFAGNLLTLDKSNPFEHIRSTGEALLAVTAYTLNYTSTEEMIDHVACRQKIGSNEGPVLPAYQPPVERLPDYIMKDSSERSIIAMFNLWRRRQAIRRDEHYEFISSRVLNMVHDEYTSKWGKPLEASDVLSTLQTMVGEQQHESVKNRVDLIFKPKVPNTLWLGINPREIFMKHRRTERGHKLDHVSAASLARHKARQEPKAD